MNYFSEQNFLNYTSISFLVVSFLAILLTFFIALISSIRTKDQRIFAVSLVTLAGTIVTAIVAIFRIIFGG